jgi:antitoxin component YwqK of YwqJK toxin-antitoxin module
MNYRILIILITISSGLFAQKCNFKNILYTDSTIIIFESFDDFYTTSIFDRNFLNTTLCIYNCGGKLINKSVYNKIGVGIGESIEFDEQGNVTEKVNIRDKGNYSAMFQQYF